VDRCEKQTAGEKKADTISKPILIDFSGVKECPYQQIPLN
jgi:hypothetical protein